MTREELTARLAECEGHTPGEWPENRNTVENLARDIEAWRGGESWKDKTGNFERSTNANKKLIALAPALPSALREAWAEIDQLKKVPRHEDGRYKDGTWTMAETRIVKRPRRYSPAPFAGYGYGKAFRRMK